MRVSRLNNVRFFVLMSVLGFHTGDLTADEAPGRPLWESSRIQGSPNPPPPLKQVVRYPNLKFKQPLYIERDPARLRLWVVTREAVVHSFEAKSDVSATDVFVDLRADFAKLTPHETAVKVNSAYGLAFHPDYPEVPVCWMTYTLLNNDRQNHLEDGTRLSRFNVLFEDGVPKCNVASEKVLMSWTEGGHNGACLMFGPDGYLYVSAGDGEVPNPPDPRRAGQNVTNRLSTIMRIDVNPGDNGPLYRIPDDNPFVDSAKLKSTDVADSALRYSASEALPEIWAYGFRNPWKMNFGPDGQLWVGDVGWELYEMVYNVKPGGNYGWSIVEGPHTVIPDGKRGPTPILPPAAAYSHSEGASVTGGFIYQGNNFSELRGKYIFGDYETRRIWAADIVPGENGGADQLGEFVDLVDPSVRIVAFGEDLDDELLLLHFDEGKIYGFERNESANNPSDFPKLLSETGLFEDVGKNAPATGLIPFRINAEMWRDGATAAGQRWLGIPGEGNIRVLPKAVRMKESSLREQLQFPTDSVLAQNIRLQDDNGKDVTLETQVLHFNGKTWNGYTYIWNPDQSDASLAPAEGATLELSDYADFSAERQWRVHSRSECLRCHNSWAGGALAFNVPQLNSAREHESFSDPLAQLQALAVVVGDPLKNEERLQQLYPSLVNPHDDAATVDARARSYLSVNCSHCHQRGAGGTATIDLRNAATDEEMKTLGVAPVQGTFQIPEAAIVAPMQPWKSVLLYRMACSGRGRMPHIGSNRVDVAGVKLIRDWISSVPSDSKITHSPKASLASTSAALELVDRIDHGNITNTERDRMLLEARTAPPEIRNLFTRFQPVEYQMQQNRIPDVATILSSSGDAKKGASLFADKRIQCVTCHRIGTTGGQIGPALDDVGRRLKPREILEAILQPSKKIDPKFAAWTALTVEGKAYSGLLVLRGESEVKIRTIKNKDVVIAKEDLEELIQQTVSLMPDRLLNDLTDEQIADLLSYLSGQTAAAK